MTQRFQRALVALFACAALSCGSDPVTGVLVYVNADDAVQDTANNLTLTVYASSGTEPPAEVSPVDVVDLDVARGDWPIEVFLRPGDSGVEGRYRLVATANGGPPGDMRRAQVISGYVRGEVRYTHLYLSGMNCPGGCGGEQYCRDGRCEDAVIAPSALCTSPTPCDGGGGEICDNRMDDDGDGQVDCMDPDCARAMNCRMCTPCDSCGPGTTCFEGCCGEALCDNGMDDDGDSLFDCDDPDCDGVGICPVFCCGNPSCGSVGCGFDTAGALCSPDGTECRETDCFDSEDDDGDFAVDCADPDCAGMPGCGVPTDCGGQPDYVICGDGTGAAECHDGICRHVDCFVTGDPDQDGDFGCADLDCQPTPSCEAASSFCDRCEDPSCRFQPCGDGPDSCNLTCDGECFLECGGVDPVEEFCDTPADEDGDGAGSCDDPDCAGQACGGGGIYICDLGNCVDGETDCGNSRDEDFDGLVDCEDPDCACAPMGEDCNTPEDDDADGLENCRDPDCAFGADCDGFSGQCWGGFCRYPGFCPDCEPSCNAEDSNCWSEAI